ncbi:hypothetical protein SLEP1_g23019 [Rubroshorea leprosula]|uniref:Uncharacterized protein n=1 Tax=Rubroshorea leprosula TaxID=152421 RepID=A0AAV5JAY4_9ROSI|nr:hypothetical protein SLEP1_g23019 [Rubroshorea leprosula]
MESVWKMIPLTHGHRHLLSFGLFGGVTLHCRSMCLTLEMALLHPPFLGFGGCRSLYGWICLPGRKESRKVVLDTYVLEDKS